MGTEGTGKKKQFSCWIVFQQLSCLSLAFRAPFTREGKSLWILMNNDFSPGRKLKILKFSESSFQVTCWKPKLNIFPMNLPSRIMRGWPYLLFMLRVAFSLVSTMWPAFYELLWWLSTNFQGFPFKAFPRCTRSFIQIMLKLLISKSKSGNHRYNL